MPEMKRAQIRELKREVARNHDNAAIQKLLSHSFRLGHKKLTLIRCLQAEKMGIQVAQPILLYCQRIAGEMPEEELLKLVRRVSAGNRSAEMV